jgi:lysophospholipase L1-like esterase
MRNLTPEEMQTSPWKRVAFRAVATAVLALGGLAVALLSAEFALRLMVKPPGTYSMLLPGTRIFEPDQRYVSGVVGPARYEVNAAGYRGRPFGMDASEYRILLIGGSTTECTLLDVSEHWGTIVEQRLNHTRDGRTTWVGNVGRSGLTARDHAVTAKYLLRQYPRIDLIVVLVGVNDLTAALRQGDDYQLPLPITTPEAERIQIRNAFAISPEGFHKPITQGAAVSETVWYKTTRLYDLARRARTGQKARTVINTLGGSNLEIWRNHRQHASRLLNELPPLDAPLTEYRSNLNAIVQAARAKGVDVVFLTQPSLWRRQHLTPAEDRLLWLGGTGPFQDTPGQAYYSVPALAQAMARYNQVTLEVCRAQGLNCFDLATAVPADTTMLYDDVHFTEAGSALVGELVAKHLRSTRTQLFAPELTLEVR